MPELSGMTLFVVIQLFMLLGLVVLVIPIFPGLVVMWLAALVYGLIAGWEPLGIVLFVIITILMIVGSLIDNLMMGAGARKSGASWLTIGVALGAGILGTLILPPFGGLIAAPLSVLLLEYRRIGDWEKAWASLRGLIAGWGLAYFVRLGIGFLLMALWWVWVWAAGT